MEELLKNASEKQFFSKIDIKSAYHQLPLNEEDNQVTVFEEGEILPIYLSSFLAN